MIISFRRRSYLSVDLLQHVYENTRTFTLPMRASYYFSNCKENINIKRFLCLVKLEDKTVSIYSLRNIST